MVNSTKGFLESFMCHTPTYPLGPVCITDLEVIGKCLERPKRLLLRPSTGRLELGFDHVLFAAPFFLF